MVHRFRHWNQVGFRAKADFAHGLAAKKHVAIDSFRKSCSRCATAVIFLAQNSDWLAEIQLDVESV